MRSGPSRGLRGPTGATVPAPLAEFGTVAPKGIHNVERLLALAGEAALPEPARPPILLLAEQFRDTHKRIEEITVQIKTQAQTDAVARRLQTIPGIGPITASAIAASVPDVSNFKEARDLAAPCWKHAFGMTAQIELPPENRTVTEATI